MNDTQRTKFYSAILIVFLATIGIGLQFFTNFYHHEDSDSIIYSIMSYTHVTLFDWGQDRLLSFAPFVVSFIKNPSGNLVALSALMLLMAFSLPFLVAFVLNIRRPTLFGFASIFFLLPFNAYFWFEQCVVPYSESFFLVCVSLLATKRALKSQSLPATAAYALVAAFLLLVSYEVAQPALAIYLVWSIYMLASKVRIDGAGDQFIVSLDQFRGAARNFLVILAFIIVAFATFGVFQYRADVRTDILNTPMDVTIRAADIARALLTCSLNVVRYYTVNSWALAATFWCGVAMIVLLLVKQCSGILRKGLYLFGLPAAIIALTMSSLKFVALNDFHQRYFIDPVFLIAYGMAFLLASIFDKLPNWDRREPAVVVALAALAIATVFVDFQPRAFATPARRIGEIVQGSDEMRRIHQADGIMGDYWRIWPAVWLENSWGRKGFLGVGQRTGYNFPRLLDPKQQEKGITLLAYKDDKSANYCMGVCFHLSTVPGQSSGRFRIIKMGSFTYEPPEFQLRMLQH